MKAHWYPDVIQDRGATMLQGNFCFLKHHDPLLLQLAQTAERHALTDPNIALVKLRQLGEAFARHAAAALGVSLPPQATQLEVLRALESNGLVAGQTAQLFHALRQAGNRAVHEGAGSRQQAMDQLRLARQLAIWFHRTFGGAAAGSFKPGPFVAPTESATAEPQHAAQLEELRKQLEHQKQLAETARKQADLEAAKRAEAEAAALAARVERDVYEKLAEETEHQFVELKKGFEANLAKLTEESAKKPEADLKATLEKAVAATAELALDEAETRVLIDAQLNQAGWQADSKNLRFAKGARPEKGTCKAIAEWPAHKGHADYVLFHGLTAVGVVEAKQQAKNVSGAIEQAKRYSREISVDGTVELPRPPNASADFPGWDAGKVEGKQRWYKVPFLYSTNGRPYLAQCKSASGIWFQDVRKTTNHARPLTEWHTPDGLKALLEQDVDQAHQQLKAEPTDYLGLRDYQLRAIAAAEEAIENGQRECLLAMATGTGKTRTVIGLIYRLLKSKRFRRILFLVDRSALGEQAQNAFKEMRLEQMQTFTEIYEVKELGDLKPEPSTKVHVTTVQTMVKRILYSLTDDAAVPIDQYDCIIVDESHRGYTLDREMGDGELQMRSFTDYISTYRRVLDHFDAVKIGLTATPALHTKQIFGTPVYTYSYREAVVDGWLIDHEPPTRITTQLAEQGIHFSKGDQVNVLHADGQLDLWKLPDKLDFDIDDFHRKVVTEGFNRAVCVKLNEHLDPHADGKTLVFCVNDLHADMVVGLLKEALEERYGPLDDHAVMKITGSVDQPLEAIRRFKNERLPSIAVTVDLLTTGIDVPQICNLVFLRRVRSRILYEQMLGRATRLCPDIHKEVFHIYDAVDIYSALEDVTSMKPVVKDVYISTEQLLEELTNPKSAQTPGSADGKTHADDVLEQLVARLRRSVRRTEKVKNPTDAFKLMVDGLEAQMGKPLPQLPDFILKLGTAGAANYLKTNPAFTGLLGKMFSGLGTGQGWIVSDAPDSVTGVEHGYGKHKKPQDYLDAFGAYLKENGNKLAALTVVLQKPRELTRQQLKELRMALDAESFNEANLQTAWRDVTNADIAAGIIGFIRQRALGSTLLPYAERVDRAYQRILRQRAWTEPQRRWLSRIAEQMKQEVLVDRQALDNGAFKSHGGFKQVDRTFSGQLTQVLNDLAEAVWDDRAA